MMESAFWWFETWFSWFKKWFERISVCESHTQTHNIEALSETLRKLHNVPQRKSCSADLLDSIDQCTVSEMEHCSVSEGDTCVALFGDRHVYR